MNAAEVIEAQADLLYRLTCTPTTETGAKDGPPLVRYVYHLAERGVGDDKLAAFLTECMIKGVGWARAYRVQENMTAEIQRRAAEYPHDAVVTAERMPPRAHGLARLEEPLRFTNHQGVEQLAHWVAWAGMTVDRVGNRATVITLWNDVWTEPDAQIMETWEYQGSRAVDPDLPGGEDARALRRVLSSYEGHMKVFGRWAPITVGYMTEGAQIEATHWATRLIVALWELLGETVPAPHREHHAESSDEHVTRTTARRARNTGVVEPAVTTVVLRRQSRPVQNPGSGTPWDSRIRIEAYEAWRWIGSGADRRRVRRMIPAHWSVNDESLPVRERKIVSELRR